MKLTGWKIWLVIILAVLAIGGGSFVYTALTNTATMTIVGGGSEFAAVTSAGYTWTTRPVGGQVGSVEPGNLFSVARDADYTGDLVFTIFITNVESLIRKYVYLNLEIKVMDGAAPSGEVTTEWLTLEEAVAEFRVPAVKTSPFLVKISDGTYRTEPREDPTAAPIFHIRVRQK